MLHISVMFYVNETCIWKKDKRRIFNDISVYDLYNIALMFKYDIEQVFHIALTH